MNSVPAKIKHYRDELAAIENHMMTLPQQKGLKVTELMIKGVYVRNLFIPAGTILTGMIHKKNCINILASGVILVWTENEGEKAVKGFTMFESKAGSKRIGKTYTDVNWVNVFAVDDDADMETIISDIATMNYDDPAIEFDAREVIECQ